MKFINKNLIIPFILIAFAPFVCASDFRDINLSAFDEDTPAEEVADIDDDFEIENEPIRPIRIQDSAKAVKVPSLGEEKNIIENYQTTGYETINAVKDNNERLYGVAGKSQVISFDKNIVRVSITNDKVADIVVLSPKQILINGKKAGATSVIFWGDNDKPMFYNLIIQQNADNFLQAVQHVAPNENISVIFNNEGAVITGRLSSSAVRSKIHQLAEAYNVKLTDVTESPTKQVLLEVKITEASKNFSRNIGLNMVTGRNIDLSTFKPNNWSVPAGFKGTANVAQTGVNGFSFALFKDNKLGLDFEASEAKGDIKILAEPKLLAVDGKEGSFNVGNQVPVPSGVGQYGNISYSYKSTGVLLTFTPTIMEDSNRIRLELKPEVSEVDDSVSVASSAMGTTVYGFKTRKVETTVELNSGETLVIAGLLQNSSSRSRTQVPILGNIPILGNLFSVTKDDKRDQDLIIFITPRIVDNSNTSEHL